MNRVQLILSLNLLLRLLNCKFLLLSDCLHCLKTFTNLFNSIILSNIFEESISVTTRCLTKSLDYCSRLILSYNNSLNREEESLLRVIIET